jgi:hypothetical protein
MPLATDRAPHIGLSRVCSTTLSNSDINHSITNHSTDASIRLTLSRLRWSPILFDSRTCSRPRRASPLSLSAADAPSGFLQPGLVLARSTEVLRSLPDAKTHTRATAARSTPAHSFGEPGGLRYRAPNLTKLGQGARARQDLV